MMNETQEMQNLSNYYGQTNTPTDFWEFWKMQQNSYGVATNFNSIQEEFEIENAKYAQVRFPGKSNYEIRATYIRPAKEKAKAIVVDFHDMNRTSRGKFYLSRYISLGYSVLAPDCNEICAIGNVSLGAHKDPYNLLFRQTYMEAMIAIVIAKRLEPDVPVYVYGEGLGGAMAIAAATMENVQKCAVLNPLLADYRTIYDMGFDIGFYQCIRNHFRNYDTSHVDAAKFFKNMDYIDCINFAEHINGKLLLGTGLLDEISPAKVQYALYNRARCEKRHAVFMKYGHERINFFENDAINFFIN